MLNLSVLLEDSARRHANKPAFTSGDTTLSFNQVNREANKVAAALIHIGVSAGDKVALWMPNVPEFPILYYGILKAGAVVVALSPGLKKDELTHYLTDSEAKVFIRFTGTPEKSIDRYTFEAFKDGELRVLNAEDAFEDQSGDFEAIPTSAEDTAVIVYTSGTTGAARGAELSHSNLFTNAVVSSRILHSKQTDVQLMALPLFHIFGMTMLLNAGLYMGVHSIMMTRFDPAEAFALMQRHGVSIFAGVPTMYWSLLNYNGEGPDPKAVTETLRVCLSGGAALALEILTKFQEKFDVQIQEGYGMSEGSPVVTFNQLETGCKPGSIGTPVWGVEVKLVNAKGERTPAGEKGELCYRGPNVMKGYYKRPADTGIVLKNGWLHSGDVATVDEDGFYFIVDRIKDIIIRGGINVYPREVEEILQQHPAISLVSVVGVPDEKWGEEIKAYVLPEPGGSAAADDIIVWAKERMASYKYPRIIEFVDQLPLSSSGKILKRLLKISNKPNQNKNV